MAAVKIKDYSHGVMLIANDLLSGQSVYLGIKLRWLPLEKIQRGQAVTAHSADDAAQLLASVNPKDALCPVVDAYIVQLDCNGMPNHSRERLRATGPSIRYGLQTTPEANDVSIQ